QILDLLISTFEDIVRANRELELRRSELAEAKEQLERYARRMEGMARSSHEKYQNLMAEAGDAILIANEDGVVQEANRQAEELYGRSLRDLIGVAEEDLVEAEFLHDPDGIRAECELRGIDASPRFAIK